ncbi:MAG: hypothetical protein MK179_07990 [Pirellulaceae bacterium]|nr:hypothetical protein [Pirellulaceae bacterium]
MLFSNERIAHYIQQNFEPTWESVRPVPRVTIDFGNGSLVRRTLHGNVATHLCTPDGKVLDIIPGIYDPVSYLRALKEFTEFNKAVRLSRKSLTDVTQEYHRHALNSPTEAHRVESAGYGNLATTAGASIFGTERGLKRSVNLRATAVTRATSLPQTNGFGGRGVPRPPTNLADWQALTEDTRMNETVRRPQIHEYLMATGPVPPDQLTKWLYRDVLKNDLDDPYLGLGEALFRNYPFQNEDQDLEALFE